MARKEGWCYVMKGVEGHTKLSEDFATTQGEHRCSCVVLFVVFFAAVGCFLFCFVFILFTEN